MPPATCPMAEFLVRHVPAKQHFAKTPYLPEDGHIALPTEPGLGLDLDPDKVEKCSVLWQSAG